MIVDLRTLQAFLVSSCAEPLAVTQCWLATDRAQVPRVAGRGPAAGRGGRDKPGGAHRGHLGRPRCRPRGSRRAARHVPWRAALLAVTGFWVSIAADVRQRRAGERAAARRARRHPSGPPPRAPCSWRSCCFRFRRPRLACVLGTVVARLLVPAVTLTATAQAPVPPPDTLFDLSQTAPLARRRWPCIPALAAALVIFRRPDPAAELRAAGRRREYGWGEHGHCDQGQLADAPRPGRLRGRRVPPAAAIRTLWLALLTLCVVFGATAGRHGKRSRPGPRRCGRTLAAAPVLCPRRSPSAGSWQRYIDGARRTPTQANRHRRRS